MSLLAVDELVVRIRIDNGVVHAVNGITFSLAEGEAVGLVGESGSGKSVTTLAIAGLLPSPNGRIEHGRIVFGGRDLVQASEAEMRRVRGRDLGMIFQDPMTSLNPVLTIGEQVIETLQAHQTMARRVYAERAVQLLAMVGLPQPDSMLRTFPHELSGGMRQRVMIAMAIGLRPKLLIADEPTTALDVTIAAQVLDLLAELTREAGMSLLLITHDMGVVAAMTDRTIVMYAGHIVESATTAELFARPAHPYTIGLMRSTPRLTADDPQPLRPIAGAPPNLLNRPVGCPFVARCAWRLAECWSVSPRLQPDGSHDNLTVTGPNATHLFACHNPPTQREAEVARPLRAGFVPAPPPADRTSLVGDAEQIMAFE